MPGIPSFNRLIIPPVNPAAPGEYGSNGIGDLLGFNGSSVDVYTVNFDQGVITAIPASSGGDTVNPTGLTVQSSNTAVTYPAVMGNAVPMVVGLNVIYQVLGSTAIILGQSQTNLFAAVNISDWNTVISNGVYRGQANAQSNSPDNTQWWMGRVEVYSGAYILQTVTQFTQANATRTIWERAMVAGAWQPWRRITGSDVPLTLIGAGGSSFGTSVAGFAAPYSLPQFQKLGGICFLSGLFTTTAALASGSGLATLPSTMLPSFSSGRTQYMIKTSAISDGTNYRDGRFAINTSGQIIFNGIVSGQTLPSGCNFDMNCSWVAAT